MSVSADGTHVAPTVLSLRKAGVNWYRTNLPALASASLFSSSSSETQQGRRANAAFALVWLADIDHFDATNTQCI